MITIQKLIDSGAAFPEYAECEMPMINLNDFFGWACADGEEVTEADLPEIQKAINDCEGDIIDGASLWACRKRQLRPQGACYTYIRKRSWHLFNAAGPEREVGFGNPYAPGEYRKELIKE